MTQMKKANEDRPFIPGSSFKNGKYYQFQDHGVTVLKAWPPQAWRKTLARPWWRSVRTEISLNDLTREVESLSESLIRRQLQEQRYCEPSGQLCLPLESEGLTRLRRRVASAQGFLQAIPQPVAQLVQKYSQRHFHMLSLLARCPGALELAHLNPGLAFMLANNWVFHQPAVTQPLRSARSLLTRRMPQILSWLGFPETRAAARIVRKVEPGCCYIDRLLYLRQAFANPAAVKALSHLPRINGSVIRVVSDPSLFQVASTRLLTEMGFCEEHKNHPVLAWRLARLKALAAVCTKSGRLGRVQRVSQLTDMLVRLQKTVGLESAKELKGRLPQAPFPGTRTIVPLNTPALVVREGVEQNNCAGSYLERVSMGRIYLYKVSSPQRCTLSLVRSAGAWRLGDVKAAFNKGASGAVLDAVHAWLSRVAPNALVQNSFFEEDDGEEEIPF